MAKPREIALNELRIAVDGLGDLNRSEPRPADFETQALEAAKQISSLIDNAKALLGDKRPYSRLLVERFSTGDTDLKEALVSGRYSDHLVVMALVAGEAMVRLYYIPNYTVDKLGAPPQPTD